MMTEGVIVSFAAFLFCILAASLWKRRCYQVTGLEYEHLVARYLFMHGYTNITVTKGSGDFGVDVIAYEGCVKYAVQCKYYTGRVGLSAVQEAVAGKAIYDCDKAMVVTNSMFTKAAHDLASANEVVLLDKIEQAEIRSVPDCLFEEAVEIAHKAGWVSVYLLQSCLVACERDAMLAYDIIASMEQKGLVTASDGYRPQRAFLG